MTGGTPAPETGRVTAVRPGQTGRPGSTDQAGDTGRPEASGRAGSTGQPAGTGQREGTGRTGSTSSPGGPDGPVPPGGPIPRVTAVRPLEGPGRWWRIVAFLAIGALGVVLALGESAYHTGASLAAGLLVVATAAAVCTLPWHRWPAEWQAAPAIALFAVAGLLHYAAADHTEFVILAALPVIWLALYSSRRVLLLGLVLLAMALVVPPLLLPAELRTHWNDAIMVFLLAALGGLAAQHVVNRSRITTAEAADVTRQARADRDLLTAYLDNAGSMVVVLDRSGRVALFNRAAEQVTGYREVDLVGKTLWGLREDPEGGKEAFERVLASGQQVHYAGEWVTRSGDVRRIAWTANSLTDDTGTVTHVIDSGIDITEKLNTQRLFRNVLAAATEHMIAATDRQGVFTVFNVGAERLLGYRADEVIGKVHVEQIHVAEELQELAASVGAPDFRTLLSYPPVKDDVVTTRESTLVRKDGSQVPVTMAVHPLWDEGEALGFVITARDITAERAAKAATLEALERERTAAARMRELDRVKSDFVASVSHDLRTPLTSIIGNTELILDGDAGELPPMMRRLLGAVDRNARRLDTLVGDLLLLSRIESGTLRMNVRPVSVREVVDGTLEAIAARRRGDIDLAVVVPHEPVLVQGDLDQLERVATNLLSNALKFTPPGGRVELRVEATAEQVEIRVTDTGIGIPTDELPHVFDRFFRSTRSQQQKRPGTGLGLTIAKSIVEQHGGTIGVGGNASGGTTFTIRLPRLAAVDATDRERA